VVGLGNPCCYQAGQVDSEAGVYECTEILRSGYVKFCVCVFVGGVKSSLGKGNLVGGNLKMTRTEVPSGWRQEWMMQQEEKDLTGQS